MEGIEILVFIIETREIVFFSIDYFVYEKEFSNWHKIRLMTAIAYCSFFIGVSIYNLYIYLS